MNSFFDFASTVASYGATVSAVWAGVYILTHSNDARSWLGSYLYNRDLDSYFYRGVEVGMSPDDAWQWALKQVESKWTRAVDPGPPELPLAPGAQDPAP